MREWEHVFEERDACVTPVLTLEEAAKGPVNAARGSLLVGDISIQSQPAPRFSRSQLREPAETVCSRASAETLASWGVATSPNLPAG